MSSNLDKCKSKETPKEGLFFVAGKLCLTKLSGRTPDEAERSCELKRLQIRPCPIEVSDESSEKFFDYFPCVYFEFR